MPALDPRTFDRTRPLALARYGNLRGYALHAGDPVRVADEPVKAGEVTLDDALHLWSSGRVVYAEQARPTPVETSQQAAVRETEMEDLGNGWFLIRAPWLAEGEKVHGADAATARRVAVIAEGVEYHDGLSAGIVVLDRVAETAEPFAMSDAGGGWYEISGPNLAEPERVRGKAAAEARLAELNGEPAQGGGDTNS